MAATDPSAPGAQPAGLARGSPPSSPEGATSEALARAAGGGDRAAFARLYERYSGMVHGILVSMLAPDQAPDLVQDVFLSALRSLDGREAVESVGPWLATIARNKARDALKRSRPEVGLEAGPEPAVDGRFARDDEEEAARVLAVLRGLPEAYRETLALRLVEGYAGPEIAARTGLTHGSVRVNLHRGMKLLRERLAEQGWPMPVAEGGRP